MYVRSACPTQLFLGQLLSGLHLLTMDYLKDGSYIFRMFKNSISECQIPSIIDFLLFKGINNASWCCSKASEDRGRAVCSRSYLEGLCLLSADADFGDSVIPGCDEDLLSIFALILDLFFGWKCHHIISPVLLKDAHHSTFGKTEHNSTDRLAACSPDVRAWQQGSERSFPALTLIHTAQRSLQTCLPSTSNSNYFP